MQVEIFCEKCRVGLHVPPEAAGHRARCPACGHLFVVPRAQDLLEETVSTWIEEDVEATLEDRERITEERLAHVGGLDGHDGAKVAEVKPEAKAPENPRRQRPRRSLWPQRAGQAQALPGGAPLPGARLDPAPELHRSSTRASDAEEDTPPSKRRYPAGLEADASCPHLAVRKVNAAGVRFAFDARWLEHEGFRASMPLRCAFSGMTAREKLIARPIIFKDRVRGQADVDGMVAEHENRQIGDRTPRQIAGRMSVLEHLDSPYDRPMPYYVSARFAHLSLHCRTRNRHDGGVTCEVTIPDAQTALEWLGRVNGVCGEDHRLLEGDASLMHGDAWQHLSDETRTRIGVWCKLGPHEVVRYFFNDADFGRQDEGLAGLVLTDQRIVFHKYHHGGEVKIDTDGAVILARPEGTFLSLTCRVGSDLSRMIKLHKKDRDRLEHALQERGRVRLVVSE